MMFFLGTHLPSWLSRTDVPLFLSFTRLRGRAGRHVASGPWALDSGGFTEITQHGHYRIGPWQYATQVRGWMRSIGGLQWASIQDWMCEPVALARTGLSVRIHQERTIDSYLTLTAFAPDVPWLPVLQGWDRADYLTHIRLYREAGIDLRRYPVVGVGSICRRQGTDEAADILQTLAWQGLNLHGFGLKVTGLRRVHEYLVSADSLAWSYHARRRPPMPGHESRHVHCVNCLDYALAWRGRLLDSLEASADAVRML